MKRQLKLIVLSLIIVNQVNSQNLIVNGDFEDVNTCVEFNAKCAPEAWFRIPPTDVNVNTKKVSRVFEGEFSEIVVIENKNHPKNYRVFLYTMLLCPLIQDQEYKLSFYLNSIHQMSYELGILFSKEELITGVVNPLTFNPSMKATGKLTKRKRKQRQWELIEMTYKAKGGEIFLTLGNFNPDPYLFSKKEEPNNTQGDLIYLIDNISLIPLDSNLTDCNAKESIKLLYNTDHRHTYKRGVRKKQELIEGINGFFTPIEVPQNHQINKVDQKKYIEISDVIFDFDKHTIRKKSISLLDSIVMTIKTYQPKEIEIIGHTDSIGEDQYNLELSIRRAKSIENYLLKNYEEYSGKIKSLGKGEKDFKLDNLTEENRMKNRRVEITLIK